MALDQFLILVEKKFHANLMDAEADEVLTLEELVVYLEQFTDKMPHSQDESDRLFQNKVAELLSIVVHETGIDESLVTPTTDLATVLKPISLRRRVWKKMQRSFSEHIPPLASKVYGIVGGFVSVCIGLVVAASVVLGQNPHNPNPMPNAILLACMVGGLAGFMCYWGGNILFGPLFSKIPKEGRTIKDIVRYAIPLNVCLDQDGQAWTRESIEKAVLRIASKTSGVPLEKISLSMPITKT
ncbi:MAG: hypothetical protein ACRC46_07110 [Thermoguttaceae bacterium]